MPQMAVQGGGPQGFRACTPCTTERLGLAPLSGRLIVCFGHVEVTLEPAMQHRGNRTNYQVSVFTGDVRGADTSGDVHIQLIGDAGSSDLTVCFCSAAFAWDKTAFPLNFRHLARRRGWIPAPCSRSMLGRLRSAGVSGTTFSLSFPILVSYKRFTCNKTARGRGRTGTSSRWR